MNFKLFNNGSQKTFVLVLSTGDEAMESLRSFARLQKLTGAQFTAIGAFSGCTVGFYDFDRKDYDKIDFNEQMEVLSINGDISLYQGDIQLHAHAVLGKRDGSAYGGHLLHATVHPTLEIMLTESPVHLRREMDEVSGIPLIKL